MERTWRLIRDEGGDAAWNMAVDEAILEAVLSGEQPPTVRFYRWLKPAVSVGRFQNTEKALNLPLCRQRGISVVRRLTGGKAVLHGHDLTVCIAAPLSYFAPARTVIEVHLRVVQALAQGFRLLGIGTQPVGHANVRTLRGSHANCFDHALPGDLTDASGIKLLGGAQYRRAGAVMEQVSIPFQKLPDVLRDSLQPWTEPPASPLLGSDEDRLVACLVEGLVQGLGVSGEWTTLSDTEVVRARQLEQGYEGTV